MSRETIAKNLKRLREQSGLTADQVGAMIGKSGKTVNAWENNRGQPDAEILIQLCDIYKVDNILDEFRDERTNPFTVSDHEKTLVIAYRQRPDMQPAVDRLLCIADEQDTVSVYRAAKSADDRPDEIVEVSRERFQKIKDAPETDDDLL